MAEEYSVFDIVFALFQIIWDGIVWIIKSTFLSILHFFMIPEVRYTTLVLILLVCVYIIIKLWKNRGGSLYKILN